MVTTVTIPAGILFGPSCGRGVQRYDSIDQSESDGSADARLRSHPRWLLKLVPPQRMTTLESLKWRQMVLALNGKVNVLAAYDPVLGLAPRGTLRGTPTLAATAAAGATSCSMTASVSGQTLLAGDLLQLGTGFGTSQLIEVAADVTLSPTATVTFTNPLRKAIASGAAVTWNKPVAYFRQTQDRNEWAYSGTGLHVSGLSLDLLEQWS